MAGFGGYGSTAKISPRGIGGQQKPAASQALSQYGTPLSGYSQSMTAPMQVPNQNIYQGADANYIRNMATAYTPEQMAQMKTAATNVQAAGDRGMTSRLSELMAARGLSGSGAETGALSNAMLKSGANLANTMSGIDISNANQGLANQYAKANALSGLMGIGLQENQQAIGQDQFGKSLYSDMFKFGKEFDYNKYRDDQSYGQYNDQLAMMMKMMGLGGGTGGTSGGTGGTSGGDYLHKRAG